MNKIIAAFLFSIIAYMSINIVYAGTTRDGADQALKKMQYMMRQVSAEKDAAKAELAKLKKELEKLEKKVAKSNKKSKGQGKKIHRLEETLAKYKTNNEAMRERIIEDREKAMEMVEKFRETVGVLRQLERDKGQLQVSLKETESSLDTCNAKNKNMYQANLELVDAYKNKGVFDALLEKEPFTGLKRVEIEKVAQEKQNDIESFQYVANE